MWVDDVEEAEPELEPELWRPIQPARAGQVVTAPANGSASRISMHTLKGHEGAQSRNASVTAAGPKFTLHFSVRDTGIGISANDLGRLFSSFTQVRLQLTGCRVACAGQVQRFSGLLGFSVKDQQVPTSAPSLCMATCLSCPVPYRWTPPRRGGMAALALAWPSARSSACAWRETCERCT